MKTLIIYESRHHGNTKRLVDAIAKKYPVDTVSIAEAKKRDLSSYDLIGIASGVAFSRFYRATEKFAWKLPEGKSFFLLFTCGSYSPLYIRSMKAKIERRRGILLGSYGCLGYDTYGPFRLIGGIAKGHPTAEDINGAVAFYEGLLAEL